MTEELAKWITQTIFQSVMDNMKDGKAVVSVNGVYRVDLHRQR